MKKVLALACLLLLCRVSLGQILDYHENMETIDSVFSSGNPAWFANQRLAASGAQSDSSHVIAGDTSLLETMAINLTGKTFVTLSFKHICKISFFDSAFVEVYDGNNWIQLTAANMVAGQTDSAAFAGLGNKFSEATYLDWQPGQNTVPDNTWWKTETFDVSTLLANVANAKVRWKLFDDGTPGSDGRAGWFIDDVELIAAPCELTPPALLQNAPVLQNVVLYTGPYNLSATISDASGLDTATLSLFYSLNGGAFISVPLTYVSGNIFSGTIPQVSDSDTVCYYFSASDASACHNITLYPALGCTQFVARSSIALPFCDGFDFSNFWTDSTIGGSHWQLGIPVTSPPSAHSAPNAWEVALNAQYLNSTTTYLYSPPMDFSGITNASLNFWFYKDCELTWDGARIDFSLDGGINWFVLGGVGTGINWYNDAQLNSSQQPAWTGIAGTWTYAEHSLGVLNNQPLSRLRFVFTSDGAVTGNGFAIDDFCIDVPLMIDASLNSIIQPSIADTAGQCIPVVVNVYNVGQQMLTSANISYSLNGSTPSIFTYTGNLMPGASVNVTLPCVVIPAGNYNLCAWLTGTDTNPVNDTVCAQLTGVPLIAITDSISYCDDFENGNAGWYTEFLPLAGTSSQWQLGAPAYGATTGAHSGTNAWDVNLNTSYFTSANAALISPFFALSSNANAYISFWHNMYTEPGYDGVYLDYRLDTSLTWIPLGMQGDPASTNWYGYNLTSVGNVLWSDASSGWKFTQYRDLTFANSHTVQFRFVFTSDISVQLSGFSLDDFCLGRDTAVSTSMIDLSVTQSELDMIAVPNPANNYLKINYHLPHSGSVELYLTDVTGRKVLSLVNTNMAKGMYTVDVPAVELSNGVYFYTLSLNKESIIKKLVIRR